MPGSSVLGVSTHLDACREGESSTLWIRWQPWYIIVGKRHIGMHAGHSGVLNVAAQERTWRWESLK